MDCSACPAQELPLSQEFQEFPRLRLFASAIKPEIASLGVKKGVTRCPGSREPWPSHGLPSYKPALDTPGINTLLGRKLIFLLMRQRMCPHFRLNPARAPFLSQSGPGPHRPRGGAWRPAPAPPRSAWSGPGLRMLLLPPGALVPALGARRARDSPRSSPGCSSRPGPPAAPPRAAQGQRPRGPKRPFHLPGSRLPLPESSAQRAAGCGLKTGPGPVSLSREEGSHPPPGVSQAWRVGFLLRLRPQETWPRPGLPELASPSTRGFKEGL